MASPEENTTEVLQRSLKRWRRIALVSIVVTLGLGGFSAYLLRSLDADYSALFDRTVPLLSDLRLLGNDALSTQRALLSALLAESEESRVAPVARASNLMEAGAVLRRSLARGNFFTERAESFAVMDRKGAVYDAAAADVVALLKRRQLPEADRVRRERARPALDEYLGEIENVARSVEAHSQSVNDRISDSARSRSAIVVGVASLPLVIGTFVLLALAALVSFMVLIFRRFGPEEEA